MSPGASAGAEDASVTRHTEASHATEDLDRPNHYARLRAIIEEAVEPPELRLNWLTDVKRLEYLESVRLRKH